MLEPLGIRRHALRARHDQLGRREPPRRRVPRHVELGHHPHPAQPCRRHDSAQVGGGVDVRRVQRSGGKARRVGAIEAQREGVRIGEVPVERVEFERGHGIEHGEQRGQGQVVPCRVDQQPAPREPWPVRDSQRQPTQNITAAIPLD